MNIFLCLLITGAVIFGGMSVFSAYTISDKDDIACSGLPNPLGCHDEDYFAFGYHEKENIRSIDDPILSIQDNKANIVWENRINNTHRDLIFSQVIDGKTTIQPKIIVELSSIGDTKIITEDNDIFIIYEKSFYKDGRQERPPLFEAVISNDDGETFTKPKQIITTEDIHFEINHVKLVNSKLYTFGTQWTRGENTSYVYYNVSDDFGKTFSEPTKLFNQGKTRENIAITVSDDVIYLLLDDQKNYDEKGHLYLIKILPDGTVTEKVSVNNADTEVSAQDIAVSGDDVYVVWSARPGDQRYVQTFAASHDGGKTFEKSKSMPIDSKTVDIVPNDPLRIFVIDDTVHVMQRAEYWDGETQTFKIFVAISENKGKDFELESLPLNGVISDFNYIYSVIDNDKQYHFKSAFKNYPHQHIALHFNMKDTSGEYSEIYDILQDYKLKNYFIEMAVSNENIHILGEPIRDGNCLGYLYSSNDGLSFNTILNLPDNDNECFSDSKEIDPPSKQYENGIEKNNIQCRTDMHDSRILFLTKNTGKPVCISSNHYYDLTKRGYLDEDSFTKLAILSGEQFLESVLSDKYDANIQNLKLSYSGQRDSLPPRVSLGGTFETDKQLYPTKNTNDYKYTVGIGVNSVNHVSKVTIDNNWDLFEQKPVDSVIQKLLEKHVTKEHTILTLEDPINKRGLLPVAVTEVKTNVNGKVIWDRFPIRDDGDKNRVDWGSLPDGYGAWTFLDKDGNDAWDNSVIPSDQFAINLPGISWIAICDDKRIVKAGGISPTVPILPEVETVYMTQKSIGIFPTSEGNYHLEFISLYETLVNLPSNATNVSVDSIICKHEAPSNLADYAFVTIIDFNLKE